MAAVVLRGDPRRLGSVAAGLLLSVLVAQPALAYTLLKNNYPNQPAARTSIPIGVSSGHWRLMATVQTTYVYLHWTLNRSENLSGELLDFKLQARNAFGRWNEVAAREPFLVETTSINGSSGYADYSCGTWIKRGYVPFPILGSTRDYTPFDLTGSGSKKRIVCSQLTVSDSIRFDIDNDPNDDFADARWLLGHELGHLLCLGHTAHVAIMYPSWPNDVYMGITPTSDDVLGLQVAYGAP